jgi:membrane-bound lytic murein transglycosylase MltF
LPCARGWEPVLYVNNIRNYYNIIRWITSNESDGEPESVPEPELPIEIASNE